MDHNIVNYIIGLSDYQTLCAATQVSKQWLKISQSQLKIRHESDPILPILHNRATQIDFVGNLYQIYRDYLTQTKADFHDFLYNIHASYNYGYNDDTFITIFNESDKRGDLSPHVHEKLGFFAKIDLLFEHVIMNLQIINENIINNLHHSIGTYNNNTSLFEKGFAILMYFKSLLKTVYSREREGFTYDKTENYSVGWNIYLIPDKLFDK